ncbi:hypothetical protein [Aquimarina litoralis]|uniref:hypothetical protein n=1 Tax=Aquimarina litoralis TaxID=584605 RepID=UPI001C5A30DD|nr:hypothetical protein [Aquimarina litoralis]MBW1296007.1 hypothetical protein [Aquimarina litoralis]
MNQIKKLSGVSTLSKKEQQAIGGGSSYGCTDRVLLCNTDSDCPCGGTCGRTIIINGQEFFVGGETCVY